MIQIARYIVLFFCCFFVSKTHCQDWGKKVLSKNDDSLFAVYTWDAHDNYHSAGGEIILTKKGRFKYSAFYPLNFHEWSEGAYKVIKDTLVLAGDFQLDNMKTDISYIDTLSKDSSYTRLSFPLNQKGDTLFNAFYFINNDTSANGQYDPMFPFNQKQLTSMKSIKVRFYETDCGSPWIPIDQPDKFIKVTLLTDKNLNQPLYKVINGWKFKIVKNKLINVQML
jgi:hypothetical protein